MTSFGPEAIAAMARRYYELTTAPTPWDALTEDARDQYRNTIVLSLGVAISCGRVVPSAPCNSCGRIGSAGDPCGYCATQLSDSLAHLFAAMSSALEEAETEAENLRLDTN